MSSSSQLDELLIAAVTEAGAHIGGIYLLDEGGEVLRLENAFGMPAPLAHAWAQIRTKDPLPIADAVREQRLLWIGGREQLARDYPGTAVALPYHFSCVLIPVCVGNSAWGGFMLMWPVGHFSEPPARQLDALGKYCAQIGEVLRCAAENGQPVRPAHRPRLLTSSSTIALDSHAHMVALEALNRLPEGYCSLDVEGRVALISAPAADLLGNPPDLVGQRLCDALPWLSDPAYEDRYRAAVVSRRVTHFVARDPDGRHLSFWLYPGLTGITIRIAPGTVTRDPAGRLAPPENQPPGMIAVHETLHLATTLARAVTAQDVVDLAADFVMPVYDVQALALITVEGGRLLVSATRGFSKAVIDDLEYQHPAPPVSSELIRTGTAAFFSDWDELRRAYPDAIRGDMRAWAFLPLITSGRPFGICVLAYDRPHAFSTEERASLTALAGLIAQAFERARLYDAKHSLATCLQSNLLPHTLPSVPGLEVAARYVPATPGMDIGGDFYDLIRLDDSLVAAVIGDVQGHDMSAAALMGQVRTAVRAHAAADARPGEVLAHTNQLLSGLARDRFTSCLYVLLNLRRHTACLASAGHLPPMLGVPGEPTRVIETTPGLLLGIEPTAEYVTTTVPLPPDSVLALYTDGLIEVPGVQLDESIGRLTRRFAPTPDGPLPELADSLIEPAVLDKRMDDIALLLLRDTYC
ncbi:Serine phosphatase RsbU, regulator of sigma subunit [Nonomuraea maritima]|uniref:protein-serine/threonine phosphatase n=1 Tax=Nonomuraea maritima TaxID=683260 RepID=A0A1G8XZT8_9ACTN|nr:SpoIIE family protein phosphatase [Nonomuraea maritima]SDJ96036.1 Serine phosphatase RsbU, regulator of sigma subunit [Nonomuraea maritima]